MAQSNRTAPNTLHSERSRASKVFSNTMMLLMVLAGFVVCLALVGLGGALVVGAWRWAFSI